MTVDKSNTRPWKNSRFVSFLVRIVSVGVALAVLISGCLIFTSSSSLKVGALQVSWEQLFGFLFLSNILWFYAIGLIYARNKRQFRDRKYKGIITLVFLVVTLGLGCWMRAVTGGQSEITFIDVLIDFSFYISLLLNAGWFFYLLAPLVRAQILNAILFMVLFVWGCVLYYCSPVDDSVLSRVKVERQIEAPNRTVAAFFPSRGGFETVGKFGEQKANTPPGNDTNRGGKRLHYFIFHTSVLFYVALIGFSIFGRGIVNQIRKWTVFWENLNVFWGRSNAGLLLARSIIIKSDKDQVYFMLQQKSGDGDEWRTLTRDIDDMDGLWSFTYDSNAVETDVSKDTLSQAKGRRHFFMDESAHVNVSRADRIVTLLRDNPPLPGLKGFWQALRAGMILKWFRCRRARVWDKPFLYIRIEAPADELTYQTWAANVRTVVTPVLIRESQLIAKDFIRHYPLLKMPGVVENISKETAQVKVNAIKILIIGFGSAGQDILSEIICNGQFVKEYDENGLAIPVPLRIDIVEQDEKVIEEYCIRHPLATRHPQFSPKGYGDKRYDVKFIERSCEEEEEDRLSVVECGRKRYEVSLAPESVRAEDKTFDDWFRKCLDNGGKKCPYDRIIVCLNGDDKTLGIAQKIVEFTRRCQSEIAPGVVFARVKDPSRNRYLSPERRVSSIFSKKKQADPEKKKENLRITLFGNMNDIYSFERINVEVVDTMAKVLNSRHGDCGQDVKDHEGNDKETKWAAASFFDQLSSRAAADGQRNILLLRGMDYRENVEDKGAVCAVSFDEVDKPMNGKPFEGNLLLRTLAIDEHLRWNAFHVMMGYRPWKILERDDDPLLDLPEKIRAEKLKAKDVRANQLETIGKHANIIEFEKLPDVDMALKELSEQKSQEVLKLKRENFVGLAPHCAQAYDIAFCQIVGKVAEEAGRGIVKLRQPK